jgi:DNA polymerase-3 subunit delta'
VYIDQGNHPDINVISVPADKQSIDVDTVREMIDTASSSPSSAPRRYVIVDGADRMNPAAANAFLKTLEEPPSTTQFLLLAESYARVIPTIRSRCGRVNFHALPDVFVVSVVSRFEPDHGKASIYARMGEGSVGRALSYWGAGRLGLRDRVFSLLQLALCGDIPSLFSGIDSIAQELPLALRFLEQLLHDILMAQFSTARLIHQDLQEGITRAREQAELSVWIRLGDAVRILAERYSRTRINLPFHLKSLFVEAFTAV